MLNQPSPKIIDISPLVKPDMAVFPGDTAFSRKMNMDFKAGSHLSLSEMNTTMHIGAHTDAPIHYHAEGEGIHQRSLDYYYGICQVISTHIARGALIKVNDLNIDIQAPRVLFRTLSYPNPYEWNNNFNAIDPETISFLAQQGVKLVGLDTPSVDPAKAKILACHHEIYKNNMAILEGVVLDHVEDGLYTLSALPLNIEDADATPVRAVLIKD